MMTLPLSFLHLILIPTSASCTYRNLHSSSAPKSPNTVALTFDDGPGIYEPELLATLAKYNAKATFFLNGNNCEYITEHVYCD